MCACVFVLVGGLEVGVVFGWRPAELYMQRHIHVYMYHTPAGVQMRDGAHTHTHAAQSYTPFFFQV